MEHTYTQGTIFRHYKGNLYEFLYLATHSENLEAMVVYKALYGNFGIWVRPAPMFFEQVTVNGEAVPRFQLFQQPE